MGMLVANAPAGSALPRLTAPVLRSCRAACDHGPRIMRPHAGLSDQERVSLASELSNLTTTPTNIHWQMRQVVFKATTGG